MGVQMTLLYPAAQSFRYVPRSALPESYAAH
jgi:hypothetical protein